MKYSLIRRFSVLSFVVILFLGVILGVTFVGFFQRQLMQVSAQRIADNVQIIISYALRSDDFNGELSPKRYGEIYEIVTQNVLADELECVRIWNRHDQIIFSTNRDMVGKRVPGKKELVNVIKGEIAVSMFDLREPEHKGEKSRSKGKKYIEIYVPVRPVGSNEVTGVFEVHVEANNLYKSILKGQAYGIFFIVISCFILYISLYQIVKKASDTLEKQDFAINELSGRLDETLKHQEMTHVGTIKALLTALDAKDRYTAGHSTRVTDYAMMIAKEMRLGMDRMTLLEEAALFHDIGKIGVPESVLNKTEVLSNDDFEQIKRHSTIGANIVNSISHFAEHAQIVRHHHERWDGRGYPDSLKEATIPLESRILAVADTYDAITSNRPYRAKMSKEKAIQIIKDCSGTQFDPKVVEAFCKVFG